MLCNFKVIFWILLFLLSLKLTMRFGYAEKKSIYTNIIDGGKNETVIEYAGGNRSPLASESSSRCKKFGLSYKRQEEVSKIIYCNFFFGGGKQEPREFNEFIKRRYEREWREDYKSLCHQSFCQYR